MEPTVTDVLSGRGACFNQHPGNEQFRRMIEEQKGAYMTGTKKQKMDMSKAIVEAIYSREPPGRFLKKCPETGQWKELSKREAADKAAQAMSYAVTRESLKQKRRERRLRSCPFPSFQQQDDVGAASSQQTIDRLAQLQPHAANNHLDGGSSSAAGLAARGGRVSSNNNTQPAGELLPGTSNLQQQLLQLQQQSNTTAVFPTPTTSGTNSLNLNNPDGSVQALAQIQILQLQRQRQMELLLHSTLNQHPPASLEELTQLLNQMQQQQLQEQLLLLQHALSKHMQPNPLTSLSASFPPTLSLSAPSLTAPSLSDQRVLQSNQRYLRGSQLATNNLLQNPVQVQSQSNPSNNAYLLSMLSNLQNQSNVGTASGGPGGVLQPQNQLLDSSLSISSSNNHLPLQQQPQYQPQQRQAAPR